MTITLPRNLDLSVGKAAAELDTYYLNDAFVPNAVFRSLINAEDRNCYLIGRTGAGKSAALHHVRRSHQSATVTIDPASLSLNYIADLDIVQYFSAHSLDLLPFLVALWKHVMILELIRVAYLPNPSIARTIRGALTGRGMSAETRQEAVEYFTAYKDTFFSTTTEKARQFAHVIEGNFKDSFKVGAKFDPVTAELSGSNESKEKTESKIDREARLSQLTNSSQLFKLDSLIRHIKEDRERIRPDPVFILIDNADHDWKESGFANSVVHALVDAAQAIAMIPAVKLTVALRPTSFDRIARGEQREKTRDLARRIQWGKAELLDVLNARMSKLSDDIGLNIPLSVELTLPSEPLHRTSAAEYVLKRTMMRPRDGILFLNHCLNQPRRELPLTWTELTTAEAAYSRERFDALCEEWETPFPGLASVLEVFRHRPVRWTLSAFRPVVQRIADLCTDPDLVAASWLTDYCRWHLRNSRGRRGTWEETYGGVVNLLYGLCFLGVEFQRATGPRFAYELQAPERAVFGPKLE